ncbi:Putative ribonuclease H protein At1g65750 [Linum perenne]
MFPSLHLPRSEPPAGQFNRPPEGDPPPSTPPIGGGTDSNEQRSYSGALMGFPNKPTPSAQPWICVGERDIIPSVVNGVRSLKLSNEFKEKLCLPWTNTVVIRLLGKSVGYSYLCNRLRAMWKPLGHMHIIDVDLDCFLVRFGNERDYFKALTGGPWMILDHYLIVQQWEPAFRVSNKLPSKMVVWVRFPHMPIQLYHKEILTSLGNLVGKTVKIDYNTQSAERGKFARIAIELDLSEPLATGIDLDGVWQRIEYENLPNFCFECGKVRHVVDSCPTLGDSSGGSVAQGVDPAPSRPPASGCSDETPPPADGFGPWLTVSRKSRRVRKDSTPIKENVQKRKEDDIQTRLEEGNQSGVDNCGKNKDFGKVTVQKIASGGKNKKGTVPGVAAKEKGEYKPKKGKETSSRDSDGPKGAGSNAPLPMGRAKKSKGAQSGPSTISMDGLVNSNGPAQEEAGCSDPSSSLLDPFKNFQRVPPLPYSQPSPILNLSKRFQRSKQMAVTNKLPPVPNLKKAPRKRKKAITEGAKVLLQDQGRESHETDVLMETVPEQVHLEDEISRPIGTKEASGEASGQILSPIPSPNGPVWLSTLLADTELCLPGGIALWLLWKARNEDIFEGKSVTSDQLRLRVHSWIVGVRETMKASSQILSEVVGRRRETLIRWIPAPDEWITVHTDGSVIQPQNLAAGGGIIRNSEGRKLAAFAANFGSCTIMRAELRAALLGMEYAWEMGARKVNVQLDSLAALSSIQADPDLDGRHSQTLKRIWDLRQRNWVVNFTHTYREGNQVADLLAHLGHSLALGSHSIVDGNSDIRRALLSDCIGVAFPRSINMNI